MAPGRIDLGIGRAPGTDMNTAKALRRGQLGAEDFPAQLMELLAFLDDDFPDDHLFREDVYAVPGPRQNRENGVPEAFPRPPVWLLGSSDYSARLAARLGFPFAFAAHLADQNVMMALEAYHRPISILCVCAIGLHGPWLHGCHYFIASRRQEDSVEACSRRLGP